MKKLIIIFITLIVSVVSLSSEGKMNSIFRVLIEIILFSLIFVMDTRDSFPHSVLIFILSISINYVLYFISTLLCFFPNLIFTTNNDYINFVFIIALYTTILVLFFRIKRFKNGFSFLQNEILKDGNFDILILNISVVIIFAYIAFFNLQVLPTLEASFSFIIFCIIIFITIKKSITLYYKHNLLVKELNYTKSELDSKKKELSELEKENLEFIKTSHSIAHKQKALEYKISKLSMNSEIASEIDINDDLAKIGNEYSKATNPTTFSLAKTGINEIDDMLDFLQNQCINNKIDFDLKLNGNIHYMTNHFISIEDLQILLADHIKDAMIAIKYSDNVNRSILVRLGLVDDVYSLYIYDSGIEFEIDTLLNLGTNPITTHSDDGGTGLGFMNTFDTLNKYSASLCINEISIPCIDNYTKAIIIKFDKLHKLEIKSYRSEDFRGKIFQNNFDII